MPPREITHAIDVRLAKAWAEQIWAVIRKSVLLPEPIGDLNPEGYFYDFDPFQYQLPKRPVILIKRQGVFESGAFFQLLAVRPIRRTPYLERMPIGAEPVIADLGQVRNGPGFIIDDHALLSQMSHLLPEGQVRLAVR
jgi:hypothetical protein